MAYTTLLEKLKAQIGSGKLSKYFQLNDQDDDELLTSYLTTARIELAKSRPCRRLTSGETVSGITSYNFPTDARKIFRVYLDGKALRKWKKVYVNGVDIEGKGTWLADNVLKEIRFNKSISGELKIQYAGIFTEEEILGTEWEYPVISFAKAICYEKMASEIRKDKTLKLEGVPEVTDRSKAFEDLAKDLKREFMKSVVSSYGESV